MCPGLDGRGTLIHVGVRSTSSAGKRVALSTRDFGASVRRGITPMRRDFGVHPKSGPIRVRLPVKGRFLA